MLWTAPLRILRLVELLHTTARGLSSSCKRTSVRGKMGAEIKTAKYYNPPEINSGGP
jgi:hypothetical protein